MESFIWPSSSFQQTLNDVVYQASSTPPRRMQQEDEEKESKLHKKAEEAAHMSSNCVCTFNDGDKIEDKVRQLFSVRWTSIPAINANTVEQDDILKKKPLSKGEEISKEDVTEKFTVSPSTSVNMTSSICMDNGAQEGAGLSLENLLRETQQQLTELVWYRRLCSAQQAALDAADEQYKTLEENLFDTRATLKEMKEHHRVYVTAAAGELRQVREALVKKDGALRVMKEEIDRLRIENERLCMLNLRAETDRAQRNSRQDFLEREITLLLEKNNTLKQEIENLKSVVKQRQKSSFAMPDEELKVEKNKSHLSVNNGDNNGEKEEESGLSYNDSCGTAQYSGCVVISKFQEELCKQQLWLNTTDESTEVLKKKWKKAVDIARQKYFVLNRRIARLIAKLTSNDKVLSTNECRLEQNDKEEHQEETIQDVVDSIIAAFNNCIDSLEIQWSNLEETVMFRRYEEEQQQQRLQDEFEKMKKLHEADLQTWKNTARESTERLHTAELRCGKLLMAIEQQSRIVIAATRVDARDKKSADPFCHERKKKEQLEDELETEIEVVEDVEYDAKSERKMVQGPLLGDFECENTAGERQEEQLDTSALLKTANILDSSGDRSVRLLVHRAHVATRKLVSRLREMSLSHNALVAKTREERQRHQAVVRQLRASLKTAENAGEALRAELAALTHSAATERSALTRRVEAAERIVGVKEKEERQRLRQLREVQQNLEAAEKELVRREKLIVSLKEKLVKQNDVTRESHFDVSTLKKRCDDLFHMMDALELQVQREVCLQNVLYETVRLLCTAVAALALRVRGVVAERDALLLAYEAQWSESSAVLQLLQGFIKDEEIDYQKADRSFAGSQSFGNIVSTPRYCYRQRLFYKYAILVLACSRMKRLVRRRHSKRHVAFVINNDNNTAENVHGYNKNNSHNSSGIFSLAWHRAAPNSLHCLINSIPLVSTLFVQERNTFFMPKIELPPLKNFVDFIGIKSIDGRLEISKDALQGLMAVALMDMNAELIQFYGLSDVLFSGPLRHAGLSASQRNTHNSSGFVKRLNSFLELMRQRFHTLREELSKQNASMEYIKAENLRLSAALKESERLSLELEQKMYEYKDNVAEKCVGRDVYKNLQQRLIDAHNALQDERKARRVTEEANVTLLKHELEMTRKMKEMRAEMRLLSIELAEQQQEEQQSHCYRPYSCDDNHNSDNKEFSLLSKGAVTSVSSAVFQNSAVNNSSGQTDIHSHLTRSVGPTVQSSSFPLSSSTHTVNADNTTCDINCCEDKETSRIISELYARIARVDADFLPQT